MKDTSFQFSEISNIEVATFDNSLSNFYSKGIEGTMKEDIQNSLDARIGDSNEPVKLKIKLESISKQDIPGIDEVFTHINSLKGANKYTSEVINHMKAQESLEDIPTLTIEDMNTKGLSGALKGQSNDIKDTYGIYAYSKGIHSIEENEQLEISRGGSHGIGKIANNAASNIHLMYFANSDEYGNQHLGGTVHLIEHKTGNQYYRSTGYFTDVIKKENGTKFFPIKNKDFSSIFSKEERGLKIVIPYIRNEFNDSDKIIKSICDNFFLSILNQQLEVSVENNIEKIAINHETLKDIIRDERYYETDITKMKKNFTPLYVETYFEENPIPIEIFNNSKSFHFKLFFKYDEEIPTGRVAIIRTIGMKIEDFKVKNNVKRPFNAVLIGGSEEDNYLKSLENESHNKISADDIRDENDKRRAKRFISNLNKKMAEVINEYVERNNPTDGFIDTTDLLFETETNFKNDLSKMSEKVNITTGNPVYKKNKNKEKRGTKGQHKNSETPDDKRRKKRKPRKLQPSDEDRNVSKKVIVPTGIVDRAVIDNHEILRFDFKEIENSSDWEKCNISFKVVDGMGVEHKDEVNLLESYSKILNFDETKEYEYDANKIHNLIINDGMIYLKLYLKDKYNKSLKFLYVVEVKNDI